MNNADQKEWLVIVNPNAGNGKGKKDWNKISEHLANEGFSFLEKLTEKRGHAIEFTIEGIKDGFRKIITVGGDGTLNEVVNGICNNEICPPRRKLLSDWYLLAQGTTGEECSALLPTISRQSV